jgi:hypothetical protein
MGTEQSAPAAPSTSIQYRKPPPPAFQPLPPNQCLSDPGDFPSNAQNPLTLMPCDETSTSQPFIPYDGRYMYTISATGKCIDDSSNGSMLPESPFRVSNCTAGSTSQQYHYNPNTLMFKNQTRNTCLSNTPEFAKARTLSNNNKTIPSIEKRQLVSAICNANDYNQLFEYDPITMQMSKPDMDLKKLISFNHDPTAPTDDATLKRSLRSKTKEVLRISDMHDINTDNKPMYFKEGKDSHGNAILTDIKQSFFDDDMHLQMQMMKNNKNNVLLTKDGTVQSKYASSLTYYTNVKDIPWTGTKTISADQSNITHSTKNKDKYCVEADMITHNLTLNPCNVNKTTQRIIKFSPSTVTGSEVTPYPQPCMIM